MPTVWWNIEIEIRLLKAFADSSTIALASLFLFFAPVIAKDFDTPGATRAPFGKAPNASLVWASPLLASRGIFSERILSHWGLERLSASRVGGMGGKWLEVPVQTGRGVLSDESFGLGGEVLLKGTGLNSESVPEVAKIRFHWDTQTPQAGDGLFTVREAMVDASVAAELKTFGLRVPEPLAVISLGRMHREKNALIGVYARKFLVQERLSNLEVMTNAQARQSIDRAIEALYHHGIIDKKMNDEEYFFFLLNELAKMAATLNYLGFEHRYLHSQQITLAGELADLGTGRWTNEPDFEIFKRSPLIPYMSFDRQPLLLLNMAVRTHRLRTETPERLTHPSETLRTQRHALLGVIQKLDPRAAEKIIRRDPEKEFWNKYQSHQKQLIESGAPNLTLRSSFSESLPTFLKRRRMALSGSEFVEANSKFDEAKKHFGMNYLPDDWVASHLVLATRGDRFIPGRSADRACRTRMEQIGHARHPSPLHRGNH